MVEDYKVTEVWKDIPKYKGYYQASNLGNIRSVPRVLSTKQMYKGHVLKPKVGIYDYRIVNISINGKLKTEKVHRLIAQTFIENPSGYKNVNHIDEDKSNNRSDNLEWCTTAYNNKYGTRLKRVSDKTKHRNCVKVFQFNMDGTFIRSYFSQNEAQRITGIKQGAISNNAIGNSKSAGGYIWKFNL